MQSETMGQRTERRKRGCATGKVPFCPVKTTKPTKLRGREGARSRGSFPATSPGGAAPLPRKPLRKRPVGLLRAIVKTLRRPGRRARFLSALPRRGGHPTWGLPGASQSILRAARAAARPRASPRPHPAPARGRGPRRGRPPGGSVGAPPAGRARRGSRAEARARGRVRPHHVAATAADGSEASWRSTIKRGFSGGREGEESEGGGRGRGGLLRPRRAGRSAPASQRRPPPRRHPAPAPRAQKRAPRRAPTRPPGAPRAPRAPPAACGRAGGEDGGAGRPPPRLLLT